MKMRSFQVCQCSAPLQANEAEAPQPTGTQVLLKMLAAGVCHSDLHIWDGYYEIGGGKKLMLADRGIKLPLTMGHENVGEVVAVGPDAKDVKVGDVRLVNPWMGCGKCKVCRRGDENYCLKPENVGVFSQGGYSTHMLVPSHRHLFDIGNLSPTDAAPLACSGVTAFSALKKIPTLTEEPVVIIGAGGVGLMGVTLAKKMGAKDVIIVDIDAAKRDAALKAGATKAVDGGAADAAGADPGGDRRRRVGRGRFRRLGRDRQSRGREHHQGRHHRDRRALRGRRHGADAVPAAARHDAARLVRGQPVRHGGTARSREAHRHAACADQDTPARRGERDAQRPARRQDRRPRGADARGELAAMVRDAALTRRSP